MPGSCGTLRGGRSWPAWPQFDERTLGAVAAAIEKRRWTVSWPGGGGSSYERRFAEQFAAYHSVPYAVAVDHGSSALVVALEALDIGPGDEVIVPAMTWVATASAVLRTGALPVLVDVDPETGCLTPGSVDEAISDRTRAVIVVHLACTVADLDGLLEITDRAGVALVEDCAQAHGARWRGRPVGTWGAAGAFSFQAGKVLAGGEGGAVITSDELLYRRMQQLRADARAYPDRPVAPGEMELVEVGEVLGANRCMSELHAALLLDQLPRLDAQHGHRERMARELERRLRALGAFRPIPLAADADRRSIYEYGIRFCTGAFGDQPVEDVARQLSEALERPVYPPDAPLHRSPLFHPETSRRYRGLWTAKGRRRSIGRAYPGAEAYRKSTLLMHHSALLGGERDLQDIIDALTLALTSQTEVPVAIAA